MRNFDFLSYKRNVTSQSGEDGIIEEIIKRFKDKSDKKCCEFGAFDGKSLSNTYNLITNHDFEGLLIEGNKKRCNEIDKNFPGKKIIKSNSFVNFLEGNTLDCILEKHNFNKNFDFLSIDVDGNDYHFFESLEKFIPKLICIEFNPTIPNEVNFVQKKDMNVNQGSSGKSLIDLAVKKNYFPIASTDCNLFFIHNLFKNLITEENNFDINKLLMNNNKNYVFVGFDGTVFTSEKLKLHWHGISDVKISALPFFLNKYPNNYNFLVKIIFLIYLSYKEFFFFRKKIFQKKTYRTLYNFLFK